MENSPETIGVDIRIYFLQCTTHLQRNDPVHGAAVDVVVDKVCVDDEAQRSPHSQNDEHHRNQNQLPVCVGDRLLVGAVPSLC